MATSPEFFTKPVAPQVARISTANTALDGTGTMGTVTTAPAGGRMVNRVVIAATGNTGAGFVRLFIDDGANIRLYREQKIDAVTVSATQAAQRYEFATPDLVLAQGAMLKASTHLGATAGSNTFDVHALCGDAQ